ncbi:MAG: ABC transporter permease [Bacteroidota bacterium]|nr:ABC transporter permease [Bacteroidota bacterium]MDX5431170.1 ABC transporter permease [Bacteroidota bacterium]MDX5469909.1 ABC transporter permease [Bacteroidota bacterium]
MGSVRLFFQLGKESASMAIQALWVNKLRSILSLTGISIGIFCIILVWTMVDSMEANINKSFESLGQNVVYIQKWPWTFGSDYPWWKYMNRDRPSQREAALLKERLKEQPVISEVSFMYRFHRRTVKAEGNSIDNVTGLAVDHNYDQINAITLYRGRYFTETESRLGSPVIILGYTLALNLFGNEDPVGKEVQMMGRKLTVIGVNEKKGKSMLGNSEDDSVIVPVNYVGKITSLNRGGETSILVKGADFALKEDVEMTIQGAMRAIRRLRPKEDDDFALNRLTMLTRLIGEVFGVLNIAGGIIGIFSILVGGFGIANIMFVSVKERTPQIGIQKSLGATNAFILFQFLVEAVLLSLLGGLIGVLFVFLATKVASSAFDMDIFLSAYNFILSNVISALIGLIAGIVPAFVAARMDPVEAMRSK